MATHAVEIINDAEPDEIVSINPQYRSGKRIHTEEDYTDLYRYLGSTDNADFARIAKARRVIFVEGKDARLLRKLASRLGFDRLSNSNGTPIIQLGGLSQWRRALNSVWAFQQILDLKIEAFCVFDRDYRCDEEIEKFLSDACAERVDCTVLSRKEIENYLLVPDAIQRAVARRLRARNVSVSDLPTVSDVATWLSSVTDDVRIKVMSRCMTSVLEFSHEMKSSLDRNTVIERFSLDFDQKWVSLHYRLSMGPGKEILARMNDVFQTQLQISLTETMLADQLSRQTTDPILLGILERLDSFCED